jgi:anti-anti-sigma factor
MSHPKVIAFPKSLGAKSFDGISTTGEPLILDFSNVREIDSRGLVALIRFKQRAGATRIVLAGLHAGLTKMVQATHLHALFDVYATVDGAYDALAEGELECSQQSGAIPIR